MSSRTQNTKRNIIFSAIYLICVYLFQLVSRTVIVNVLGKEYLGISSLFTSILQILSMAELGFAGAIVYNMYKPLAENDVKKVCALLNYYKKIYRIVGTVVLVAGIIIMPFIPKIIKGSLPEGLNLYVTYLLYLLNTSISYFLFSYKTSLIEALQRLDLVKLAYMTIALGQSVLQIVAIAVFKNYYLFVIVLICSTAFKNVFVAIISKKYFPQYTCRGNIDDSQRTDIKSRVNGLLICSISGVTYTTLDSIILSATIGLDAVAKYNNYILIFTAVSSVITMIRQSMQASIGNSVAIESREKNYNDMLLWQFLFSIIATFCATCLVCLYQPFMEIWMGMDMLLPMRDVILFSCWFLVGVVQHAYYLYLSGGGFWHDLKWSYVFNTLCNLFMNIILGKLYGITGIIMASLLTCIISGTFWQCVVIFRKYFKKSSKQYLIMQFKYFVIAMIIAVITFWICHFIQIEGIIELIVKTSICCVVCPLCLFLFYHRNENIKRSKELAVALIMKR